MMANVPNELTPWQKKELPMTQTMTDPAPDRGFGYGEGLNQQERTVWHLRPPGGGPPVKIKMAVVDAKHVAESFPREYRYFYPGDETPERTPMSPEEIETQTHHGKIAKLQAQLAEAQTAFSAIVTNLATQINLEHDAAQGKQT